MQLFGYIFIFFITIVSTEALACYNCSTQYDTKCTPGRKAQPEHLVDCPENHICGLTITVHPNDESKIIRIRACVPRTFCPLSTGFPICCPCDYAACNNDYLHCKMKSEAVSLSVSRLFFILITFTIVAH